MELKTELKEEVNALENKQLCEPALGGEKESELKG